MRILRTAVWYGDVAGVAIPEQGVTLDFSNNPGLVNVNLPTWLSIPNGAVIDFSGCALSVASINNILGRCTASPHFFSGSVNLSGGTSAHPNVLGNSLANILDARGIIVTVN